MVLETSVLSTFNHLTRLEARENFIKLSRRESLKSLSECFLEVPSPETKVTTKHSSNQPII
jgi:hypothetical protein